MHIYTVQCHAHLISCIGLGNLQLLALGVIYVQSLVTTGSSREAYIETLHYC